MTVYAIMTLKRENRDCAYLSSNYPRILSSISCNLRIMLIFEKNLYVSYTMIWRGFLEVNRASGGDLWRTSCQLPHKACVNYFTKHDENHQSLHVRC